MFWLCSCCFVTSLLCLVLFSLSGGWCADTEARAKRFDLRGIATAELFGGSW